MLSLFCEWDQRIAKASKGDPRAAEQAKEAFRQGSDGVYRDMLLVSHAWGLDIETNTVPVFLWHGTADTMVPVSSARAFAKRIPGCEAHFIQDAGHMLLRSEEVSSEMMGRIASLVDQAVTAQPSLPELAPASVSRPAVRAEANLSPLL